MKHKILTYSFVGLWHESNLHVPLLSNKFCKFLYNDPINTISGMSSEGFVITQEGAHLGPKVVLNPLKILVQSTDLNQVLDVLDKVVKELQKDTGGKFSMKLKAIGINTEHEWLEMDQKTTNWLTNKFLIKGLRIKEKQKDYQIQTTDINFQIIVDEDQKFVIILQPRSNVPNGLFVNVNNHIDKSFESIPDSKDIKKFFNESVRYLEKYIFNLFIN